MKDFNIAKYLKENHLGSHAILGAYVDLHALKEVEDMEGLEIVKGFGALKDKSVADKYADVCKQAGMEGVKVVEKDGVFKIYAKAGQKLNKEADYGNNEPVDEVPYVGAEEKLDGFGDEFDQVAPVEEEMNNDDEDLSWMKDDRFADLGGDQIKAGIKSLMDDGFDAREIAQFVVDTIRAFKSFKEEVTVSSSGVEMEEGLDDEHGNVYRDLDIIAKKIKKAGAMLQYDEFGDSIIVMVTTKDGDFQLQKAIYQEVKQLVKKNHPAFKVSPIEKDSPGRISFSVDYFPTNMEEGLEGGEEWEWSARDQQGKLYGTLYVKPMGDTLMVTADDGMPGISYSKEDIIDAMGRGEFLRFRGKNFALDTRMKAWANS